MNLDLDIKTKPYEAQNTKFSEDERRSLISEATSELLKFKIGRLLQSKFRGIRYIVVQVQRRSLVADSSAIITPNRQSDLYVATKVKYFCGGEDFY